MEHLLKLGDLSTEEINEILEISMGEENIATTTKTIDAYLEYAELTKSDEANDVTDSDKITSSDDTSDAEYTDEKISDSAPEDNNDDSDVEKN